MSAFSRRLADRCQGRLDAEADEYLQFILDGTERMHALIEAILAYSRVGRAELHLESVDVQELVEQIMSSLGTDRVVRVEVGDLPTLVADRSQLGQIFQNLIGNALKFVDDDEPLVRVDAERDPRGWRFDVTDNGIGIDPRYAERIFEVFQRLHSRETYAGTGIGLSICERAVERHGGRIWAAPADGGGTVFSFTLPDSELP